MSEEKRFIKNKKILALSISLVAVCVLAGILGGLVILTNIEYSNLSWERDVLSGEYDDLLYNFNDLNEQYFALTGEYIELEYDYNDLLNNYDILLDAYNTLLYEYNSYKQQIEYNTGFSGHFLTLIDWSSYYGTISHKDEVQIGYEDYFSYRLDYPHPSHSYYDMWIVADVIASYCLNSTVIYTLARGIMDIMDVAVDPTEENRIDALLTLVQDRGDDTICINYIPDGTDDFAKYPIETLTEGNGDCEDKTILFISLCASVGYSCAVCVISEHVYAVVHLSVPPSHNSQTGYWYIEIDGLPYYTCETTGFGWRIGDLPESSQGQAVYYQIVEF